MSKQIHKVAAIVFQIIWRTILFLALGAVVGFLTRTVASPSLVFVVIPLGMMSILALLLTYILSLMILFSKKHKHIYRRIIGLTFLLATIQLLIALTAGGLSTGTSWHRNLILLLISSVSLWFGVALSVMAMFLRGAKKGLGYFASLGLVLCLVLLLHVVTVLLFGHIQTNPVATVILILLLILYGVGLWFAVSSFFRERPNYALFNFCLVVLILFSGVSVSRLMVMMKKPPAKRDIQEIAPLVNTDIVNTQDMPMVVKGFGTVEPRTQVQIVPQVSGQVVECSPNLINGGFIEEGELVLRIDQRDYRLAVEAAQADVARAQVALDTEEAEAAVALREWQQLNPGTEPTSPLVLRQPQIRQAKATLEAARANLNKAKLALERTEIRLPFNARVSQESVDIGQFVSPGQMLATVYGTDVAEIVVPLEDRELEWFDVPILKTNGNGKPAGKGSPVLVHADFAGQVHTWNGRIVRTEGRIDAASRVVNVVVEVTEPFETTDSRPPLVPGMFVEVEIQGRQMDNIIQVPRYAVHNGDEIWVVNDEKLHIRKVKIARKDKEYSYISEGLEAGEVFITSPMDTVTDGMAVRAQLPETAQTQQGEDRE